MATPETASEREERIRFFEGACTRVHEKYLSLDEGAPADYIPELQRVDPDRFALASMAVDGRGTEAGECSHRFTIQSISKLLLYGLALETHGRERVLQRVGVSPTADSFNAISLERTRGRAPNPMVNAGAIAITDLVEGPGRDSRIETILEMFESYLGRRPEINEAVWTSEIETGHRNRAIGHLLLGQGIIEDRVEETLEVYFAQCAVEVTTIELARVAAILANYGRDPEDGATVVSPETARDMLTVALTCGMYDYAGEWAYSVGIPAKSGVGGGILGVLPGVGGIAAFSPRLDAHGHSVRGVRAFEDLSREFDMHLFDPDRPWRRATGS